MLLATSTWPEIEVYLERSGLVLVPIGSTEQHGPVGLLGTDWICPEAIAQEAGRRSHILVAPTFNVGVAHYHLGFPGTISYRPATFQAALGDWIESLAFHGFRHIFFLNGHGGNVAGIQAAFQAAYAERSFARSRSLVSLTLRNWWDLDGVAALAANEFPEGHGMHGTPSEISVTQWTTGIIAAGRCAPRLAPVGPVTDALEFRDSFPDGRVGSNSALASPEAGERLVSLAVRALLAELGSLREVPVPA